MKKLRVLITNNTLAGHTGSELYVRDVATALLDRGHTPIAYSTHLGAVAAELSALTIPVIDNLNAMAIPPDVIHGHHNFDLLTALLYFPGVPAVGFCHGWLPWQEAPLKFPRVRRYVAVSQAIRDKLICEHAIPIDRIQVLLNFFDPQRFKPRDPLPPSPKRALVFSNNASEDNYLGVAREACARFGIAMQVIGMRSGNVCARPEDVLGGYDLIFARGRCALEGLAVGAAVILCDIEGTGPMVTTENLDHLRSLNFGLRALREPVGFGVLTQEIARYDSQDATEVSLRIREAATRDAAVEEMITLYQEAITEQSTVDQYDIRAEGLAVAEYLRWLTPLLKESYSLENQARQAILDRDWLKAEKESLLQHGKHSLLRYRKRIMQRMRRLIL